MTSGQRETVTQGNSLPPERFTRVRAVFEEAVERPAVLRRGFVGGACGDDEVLRREFERMLAADHFLERRVVIRFFLVCRGLRMRAKC